MSFDDLLSEAWQDREGASPKTITRAERKLGVELPADYKTFMAISNGWEGDAGAFDPIEEVADSADTTELHDHMQGWVLFGSNGAGEAFVFDADGQVLLVPWIGDREDAIPQGTFTRFTERLLNDEMFDR